MSYDASVLKTHIIPGVSILVVIRYVVHSTSGKCN